MLRELLSRNFYSGTGALLLPTLAGSSNFHAFEKEPQKNLNKPALLLGGGGGTRLSLIQPNRTSSHFSIITVYFMTSEMYMHACMTNARHLFV